MQLLREYGTYAQHMVFKETFTPCRGLYLVRATRRLKYVKSYGNWFYAVEHFFLDLEQRAIEYNI